jgi:uncharacterized protein YcfJ
MMLLKLLASASATAALAFAFAPATASAYDGYSRPGFQTVAAQKRGHNTRGKYYNSRRANERCRDKGNGGLAIGAIAGGLLGHEVAGRGDRTLGTVIGAGAGALAGRAIDRSDGRPCR